MGLRSWLLAKLGAVPRAEAQSDLAALRDEFLIELKAQGSFADLVQAVIRGESLTEDKEVAQAYDTNLWVHRCVSVIAHSCAQVPLRFFRERNGEREEITSHPALDVLDFVNEEESTVDLKAATFGWLAYRGEAYWLLERTGNRIRSIRTLHPARVKVVPATTDEFVRTGKRVSRYEYTVDTKGKPLSFPADDVVQFKEWDPENDLRGLDTLAVAKETIKADWRMRRQAWTFLKNFSDPGAFLESDADLIDATYTRVRRQIEQQNRGVNRAGEIYVASNGLKWKQPEGKRDLGYMEGRKMSRSELAALWGVPPLMLGVGDDAKYDSADAQERYFWLCTIAPRLLKNAADLGEKFISLFPNSQGIMAEYNTSAIPAFQKLELERAERVEKLTTTLTINERRAVLGHPPLPGGDVILAPLSLVPVAGDGVEASDRQQEGARKRARMRMV